VSALSMTGYSDRINHALAFAAKHHDQQVRRGVRLPYLTQPANVALILTRYGQSEDTVVAGILLNVVKDYVSDGRAAEVISERIGDKFGQSAFEIVLAATPRGFDDDGVALSQDERRSDFLNRLATAPDEARWVVAADVLHESASALADVRRTIERRVVWSQRGEAVRRYGEVSSALQTVGFGAPIMNELTDVLGALDAVR
jgi:HD domain-containing protein